MSLRILLIRHGETVWNSEGRCQGFSDISLNAAGQEQAAALARALRGRRLDAVYSSDLARARKTAEMIAESHQLQVQTDARFRELNQGQLEGKKLTDLLSDHPELLRDWMARPAEVVMPGGESMRSLQQRAWAALSDVVGLHDHGLVAVASHNLAILSIVCKAIELDLDKFRRLRLNNASITELEFARRQTVLVRINDVHHLS